MKNWPFPRSYVDPTDGGYDRTMLVEIDGVAERRAIDYIDADTGLQFPKLDVGEIVKMTVDGRCFIVKR